MEYHSGFQEMPFLCTIFLVLMATACTGSNLPPSPAPTTKGGLKIVSNVTQVQPSVTNDMAIECTMSTSDSSDGNRAVVTSNDTAAAPSIVSLIILKWNTANQNFVELASVNVFHPRSVNIVQDVGATVSGWVVSSTGRATLKLHWDYPGQEQAGRYLCEANTMDNVGHSISTQVSLDIGLANTDLSIITDSIRDLKDQVLNLTDTVGDLVYTTNRQKSSLDYLRNSYYDLSKKVRDMKVNVFQESSVTIDGQKIYWSDSAYYSFDAAQAMCTLIGGKLAELDPNKIASKSRALKAEGYSHWGWIGPMYLNGTMFYPSTGKKVDFTLNSTPETDPACTVINPDITHVYTVPCTRQEAYHAFCTVG